MINFLTMENVKNKNEQIIKNENIKIEINLGSMNEIAPVDSNPSPDKKTEK